MNPKIKLGHVVGKVAVCATLLLSSTSGLYAAGATEADPIYITKSNKTLDLANGYYQTNANVTYSITVIPVYAGGLTIAESSSNVHFKITGGYKVSDVYANVAKNSGSSATVTVTGSSSTWATTANLTLGDYGNASLNILNGGSVTTTVASSVYIANHSSSTSSVTVSGSGSSFSNSGSVYVGNNGNGTLNIESGATASGTNNYVGSASGSTGTVNVSSGSTWSSVIDISVGGSGTGYVNVTSGGKVTNSGIGYIGKYSGSHGYVTVSGTGSSWTNSAALAVGNLGSGSLTISNGGKVTNTLGYLGQLSGSSGTVLVTGVGSIWANTYLYVGLDFTVVGNTTTSTGLLTITDGALVTVSDTISVGSNGEILIGDGYLAVNGTISDISAWLQDMNINVDVYGSVADATAENTVVKYYTSENYVAGDKLYDTYNPLGISLVGYTVLTAVPEPSTYALFGGLMTLGVVMLRRRKDRSQ